MFGDPGQPVTRFGTPFRLGCTSYVYRADLLTNIERLGANGDADDVELVLFDLDGGPSNMPDPDTVEAMAVVAEIHGLSFTVHLPEDIRGGENGHADHPSLVKARQVIELTAPLHPAAYVFHLESTDAGTSDWYEQAFSSLEHLCACVSVPAVLALENLESYDPAHLEPVFEAFPVSRTLDIGHIWKMQRDPLEVLDTWLPHTRVVHLHGMAERDHVSLDVMQQDQVDTVVARLMDFFWRDDAGSLRG